MFTGGKKGVIKEEWSRKFASEMASFSEDF